MSNIEFFKQLQEYHTEFIIKRAEIADTFKVNDDLLLTKESNIFMLLQDVEPSGIDVLYGLYRLVSNKNMLGIEIRELITLQFKYYFLLNYLYKNTTGVLEIPKISFFS